MKMFIWDTNILTDYNSGCAIAVAESIDEARVILLEKYKQSEIDQIRNNKLNAHGPLIEKMISEIEESENFVEFKTQIYAPQDHELSIPNAYFMSGGS